MDSIFMPFRALFVGEESRFWLSSMRDERLRRVAAYCRGRVLDVGCGPGNFLITRYIGKESGIGLDCYPYPGVDVLVDDMTKLPYDDNSFDTVAMVAVGGHIPESKRVAEFAEFARILKPGGRLVMTEGEPITQWLRHKWLAIITGGHDMDSERGMEEDEQYCMPRKEIFAYLNTPPLRLVRHERFQWRLNNVYVAEKVAA
jgi:SAM-dependent methyltransferase